jgi:hypothetical protein
MHEKAVSGRIDPPTEHLESASLGALEQELGTIDLGDARLNRRAQRLIKQLGAHPSETRRGLSLPPTLAVTPERVPLGVLNGHSWARAPGRLGQDKAASRPLEEKESVRWVNGFAQVNALAEELPATRLTSIADREGDLYDLFVEAPCPEQGADWLVRGQYHERRLTEGRPLSAALAAAPVLTTITFTRLATANPPGPSSSSARRCA